VQLRHCAARIGRFRVSAFVQQGAVGCVIRLINAKIRVSKSSTCAHPQEVVLSKRGLVILVGGTGSVSQPRSQRWWATATRRLAATSSRSKIPAEACGDEQVAEASLLRALQQVWHSVDSPEIAIHCGWKSSVLDGRG